MKTTKKLISIVLGIATLIGYKSDIIAQNIGQSPANNIENFAVAVFNSFKNNDFNSYINLLPSPPFTLNLKSLEQGKENFTITEESFSEWKSNYKNQFNSIITAMNSEGIILGDLILDKIIVEFDSDNKFQVIEIYLVLRTWKNNNKYRIRIEDCLKVGDKYFPEQLKWVGQKEYTR